MLTAVFIVGKLGKNEKDYRYLLVDKVPDVDYGDEEDGKAKYDHFKIKHWSNTTSALNRLAEGRKVALKGRLEEVEGETFIIAELYREF
ncbi:MAG: hypothetical protein BWY30_00394 [Tenericutes bacterium ADurb.Bin239]|jgi:hypothetical protein|nr:MAG: hypothetical protein BWY30_00394 [Tenericutes bacterium ADurb.Bin239]